MYKVKKKILMLIPHKNDGFYKYSGPEKDKTSWFQKNWKSIVIGILIAGLIGVVIWLSLEIHSNNNDLDKVNNDIENHKLNSSNLNDKVNNIDLKHSNTINTLKNTDHVHSSSIDSLRVADNVDSNIINNLKHDINTIDSKHSNSIHTLEDKINSSFQNVDSKHDSLHNHLKNHTHHEFDDIHTKFENITQQLILVKELINETNLTSTQSLKTLKDALFLLQDEVQSMYSNSNLNNNGVISMFNELNNIVDQMNTTVYNHSHAELETLLNQMNTTLYELEDSIPDDHEEHHANIHHIDDNSVLLGTWDQNGGPMYYTITAAPAGSSYDVTLTRSDGGTHGGTGINKGTYLEFTKTTGHVIKWNYVDDSTIQSYNAKFTKQ